MANKTIYDLTENQTLDADDLFEQDVLQNNERKSLKTTLGAIANKIITNLTYNSLNTTSKTVVGAINELEQGGGGTGGHTIIDENGNNMTARSGLQFTGAVEVTDDSVNNKTIVDVLGGDFYNPVIYSTEEQEIGVWTDGKPLYQKSYVGIDITVSYNSWGSSGITLSNVDTIVKAFGTATDGSFQGDIMAWNDSGDLKLQTGRNGRDSNVDLLTIQYTKTTDVAGSGSWTPQGVPTHHYSTDEQIVGTYLGETLYEKTYTGLNVDVAYNSWTNVVEVASDMDVLVGVEILSSNTEKHNITGSGIEYYIDKTTHYIKAEYNQNVNRRNIGTITVRYTKSS